MVRRGNRCGDQTFIIHHEGTKDTKISIINIPNFVLFATFVVKGNLTAYFVVLIPSESMIPAMRLVSSSMNFL